MITTEQIARINELAKKSREVGLNEEETKEQFELRQLYINSFKNNLKATMDTIVIQNPDGSRHKLQHKPKDKEKQ